MSFTPDASGLKMWAKRHGLSNETSRVLIQQGFTSVDDLSLLTAEEVTESFQKRYLLPLKQCLLLKKAVAGSTSGRFVFFDSVCWSKRPLYVPVVVG